MTAQNAKKKKKKKIMLGEFFCIFECQLTKNPTNQGSQLS